jgi:hypothetical protein
MSVAVRSARNATAVAMHARRCSDRVRRPRASVRLARRVCELHVVAARIDVRASPHRQADLHHGRCRSGSRGVPCRNVVREHLAARLSRARRQTSCTSDDERRSARAVSRGAAPRRDQPCPATRAALALRRPPVRLGTPRLESRAVAGDLRLLARYAVVAAGCSNSSTNSATSSWSIGGGFSSVTL